MSRIKVESGRWAVNSMQPPILKRQDTLNLNFIPFQDY